jgi:uncharacterized protein YifE (UPF0438 family)
VAAPAAAPARKANPLGAEYQQLVHRGRGTYKLALGDLRQLLQKCKTGEDLRYGAQLVQLFQTKGQDFSEEVNSHFVSMCVRAEQPQVAIEHFSKYKNRIGSWTTPKSFHNLATDTVEQNKPELVQALSVALEVMVSKGVIVSSDSLKLLLQRAGESETHARLAAVAGKVLGLEAAAALVAAHPAPAAPAAAPAAPAAAAVAAAPAAANDAK